MNDEARIGLSAAIVGAGLGILCCAAPLLVAVVLGDLTAVFVSRGSGLILALVATVAVLGFLFLRHRARGRPDLAEVDGGGAAFHDCRSPAGAEISELAR